MALKSYFDGGNQADSRQYDIVTLAAFSGTSVHWKNFEDQWRKKLSKHGAPWLHTTDAVGLTDVFSKRKGWSETRVEAFIDDCVSTIETCAAIRIGRKITYSGLRPATASVLLKDFIRAVKTDPDLPCVEHLCATGAATFALAYGAAIGAERSQFYFDQGEHFMGHISDRVNNRKSRKTGIWWNRVVHVGQSDMRQVPALQAADVLAWSVNHKHQDGSIRFDWQRRLLAIDREIIWLDYATLQNPIREHVEMVKSYKLPPRKPVR